MPVARKEHRCILCGEPIPKGELYFNHRMTPWEHSDNDGFFTIRAHVPCWEFWERYYGEKHDWEFPWAKCDQDDFKFALSLP